MSANNYILIKETKPDVFSVVVKDADTWVSIGYPKSIPGLRNAIEYANKIMTNEEVEYGLEVMLKDKK